MKKTKPKKPKRGRPEKITRFLPKLKSFGVFRIQDAIKIGISQPSLSRLVATGQITRLGPGLYGHPESTKVEPQDLDYVIACARFGPQAIVGGMTALFLYRLIEQVPTQVWMIVPYNTKTTLMLYRCIRTKTDPRKGVVNRGSYRITNLERTLVEAFRYASKMGLRTAIHATRTAIKERKTTLDKIMRQAKELGLEKFIERYWETLVPESEAA